MKLYNTNHNGKGKVHLLSDELEPLCGNKTGDFSPMAKIGYDGENYIEDTFSQNIIQYRFLKIEYCLKCLAKIKT